MLLIRRIVWKRWPPFLPSSLSFPVYLEETYVYTYIGGVFFFFLMQWVVQEWKIARDSLRYGS